jgi:hypothetical protein
MKILPMRLFNRIVLAVSALICILPIPCSYANETIVILRHGEKPARGLGQLSCQGLNRSLALPSVLLSRYGNPTAIYAPNPAIKKNDKGMLYAYIRPLATIEPLAIRAGLPVNLDWGMADVDSLAKHILAQSKGIQIIAWEHHYGESLTKRLLEKLGGDPSEVPDWKNADFDSLYVIRVVTGDEGKKHISFAHEQEGLDYLPRTCPQ